jgi:arylsulfatase A-like enzyme
MPYAPAEEFLPQGEPQGRFSRSFEFNREVRSGDLRPTAEEKRQIKKLYLAEVRQVDAQIGRILDRLQELSFFDSCLIAFTSDHGEEFWEHDRFEHGQSLYDELMRVPLAIKLPGAIGGVRVDAAASHASLMPTMLEILGVPIVRPDLFEPSLRPLWTGAGKLDATRQPLMTGVLYRAPATALLIKGLKVIRDDESGIKGYFDLEADPGESRPLAEVDDELRREAEQIFQEKLDEALFRRQALGLDETEERSEIPAETLRELKALGYID